MMPFWCSSGGAFQERKNAEEFIQLAANPAGGRVGTLGKRQINIYQNYIVSNYILHFTFVSVVIGGYYFPYTEVFPISYLVYSVNYFICLLTT